jgi:hypothetical protein
MTGDYTFVTAERQNELTRRIQERLAMARNGQKSEPQVATEPSPGSPDSPPNLADMDPVTAVPQ